MYRVEPASRRSRLAGTPGVAHAARRSGRRDVRPGLCAVRRRSRRGRRHAPAAAARRGGPARPRARPGDDDASPAQRSRAGQRQLPAYAQLGATVAPGADQRGDSGLARALALRGRAERDRSRPAAIAARDAQQDPRRNGVAERDVPLAARPHAEADLGADGVGPHPRHRRERDEDRDPRRRARPDPRLLRSGGLRVPRGLPAGATRRSRLRR